MLTKCAVLVFLCFCLDLSLAGFVHSESVWVGDTPVLQFLLKCKLVKQKMNGLSTDDIYTKKQMEKGIIKLQILAGLPVTGVADAKVLKMVERNKCLLKSAKQRTRQGTQTDCRCNGVLDYNGNGQCHSTYLGYRWCYVSQASVCGDRRGTGGSWWSHSACSQARRYNSFNIE
eukprot:GFUD01020916.1.p1 GENE.GFUD01020916.1~~GFUD01020916.1.p1  ORF type:complete len:173 (+),score=47.67 GFUD01020916.1:103-621(+)